MKFRSHLIFLSCILTAVIGACSIVETLETPEPFILPTLAAPATPADTPLPTSPPSTPTPDCTDNLQYLEDITIPDGTVVSAGARLDKRWQVRNPSNCNWNQNYSLRLITGSDMGALSPQPLVPATAGSEAVIRIIYTAPDETGVYRSAWQAHDPNGSPFGDPIFIEIVVQ